MGKSSKNRIWELDFLRGLVIVLMIFDHITFDLSTIIPGVWADKLPGTVLHQLVLFAREYHDSSLRNLFIVNFIRVGFFFISGICTAFTRSPLRRTAKLAAAAAGLTLATWVLDEIIGARVFLITAGVIHTFAVCSLLELIVHIIVADKRIRLGRVDLPLKSVVMTGLLVVSIVLSCTAHLFTPTNSYLGFLFGFPFYGQYSVDYIPVLPWCCMFFAGAALSPFIYKKKTSLLPRLGRCPVFRPLTFVGQKSLWIYLVHQPVVYALLTVFACILYGEIRVF